MAIPQNLKLPLPVNAGNIWRAYKLPVMILLVHLPLGILLRNSAPVAAAHAYGVVFVGVYLAMKKQTRLDQLAAIAAYLVGSEVLWRMAEAPIYWEFGKYATALIFITALVVRNKWKIPTLPLIYFALLVPACFLTILNNDFLAAKDKLSFNISGPFLLFISCWFFSNVKVNWLQLRKILFWLMIPLASVGVTTLFYTVTLEEIRFNGESNHATSGGFGPNQVSVMLGLGVFICISSYLLFKNQFKEKFLFGILTLFFAMQSVMTFSRGGIYNAGAAVMAVLFFQMKNAGKGFKQLLSVAILVVIFLLVIFPRMNDFTEGALQNRFEDTNTTGRLEIAESDVYIFLNHPVWGVGAGESFSYHREYFKKEVAAHTEFTRLISEHGIFGVFSLLVLGLVVFLAFKRQKNNLGKAIAGGFIVWSSFFMINTGMRLAAPAFIWGMSFIALTAFQVNRTRLKRDHRLPFRPGKDEVEKQPK